MSSYLEMKEKHAKLLNSIPIQFAFSKKDLKEGLKRLGLLENDIDKVVSLPGGGFMKKEDVPKYMDIQNQIQKEFWDAIDNDKDGAEFICEMFSYELENHEYVLTGDLEETLEALNLTPKDFEEHPNLKKGLDLAKKKLENLDFDYNV